MQSRANVCGRVGEERQHGHQNEAKLFSAILYIFSKKNHMAKIEVILDDEIERFSKYLRLTGNDRIIFSGIFGSGKTTFLKQFFKKTSDYIGIHLYPTNYSVSSNEDIFELLKVDLLFELLKHNPPIEKVKVSKITALTSLTWEDFSKLGDIAAPTIEKIPKVGKTLSEAIATIPALYSELKKKQASLTTDEGDTIIKLMQSHFAKKGGLYEQNEHTELITDLINRLRANNKQIVLIIDDLDRIDPEHIFRILNVFAVHFNAYDLDESENKFSLDKIILSCDINNIRSIFAAKYGQNVDFSGYIDKFYSRDIYHFNLRPLVVSVVDRVIQSIKVDRNQFHISPFTSKDKVYFGLLHYILISLIASQRLNLRTLLKVNAIDYEISEYSFYSDKDNEIFNWQVPVMIAFDFLTYLYGDIDGTKKALTETTFIFSSNKFVMFKEQRMLRLHADLLMFADYKYHRFKSLPPDANPKYMLHMNSDIFYADHKFDTTNPGEFKQALLNAFKAYEEVRLQSLAK